MKTLFTTIMLFLFWHSSQAQVPSINEKTSTPSTDFTVKLDKVKMRTDQIRILEKQKAEVAQKLALKSGLVDTESNLLTSQVTAIDDDVLLNQKLLKNETDALAVALLEIEYDGIFPTINKAYRNEFFKLMYNKNAETSFLNSFAISADTDGAVAQSEIVTDNIWAFRIAFGTIITAPSNKADETTETALKVGEETSEALTEERDAFKRLINGGGNFYLEAIFPILSTNQANGDQATAYLYANAKGAMDLKGFGNNLDTSTGNGSVGINGYLGASSANKKFNFFIYGNANYTFGTDDFYTNLGLEEEKPFFNARGVVGVTLLNAFKISATVNNFGSDEKLRTGKVLIGVQILPGF